MTAEQNPDTDSEMRKLEMIRLVRFAIGKFFGSFDKLPKIFISLAILVLVFKTRPADVPAVIKPIAEVFSEQFAAILGWIIAIIVVIFSIILVKAMRSFYNGEIKRVAKERDGLQEILNKRPVQHSEER
jgi:hypothetical protein